MTQISPLHSDEGRQLLDVIDRLRLLPNIRHELALPQIAVVGQQSSGKSSVLKAISNIDFPTNSGFCTQFATEIICRRENQTTTRVSIIPYGPVDTQYRTRLDAFTECWRDIQANQDISAIIQSAAQAMGLNSHRRISRDKLRLEFSGPKQDHISLIDLPGLFEQKLPGQREDDKKLVDDMVQEYISGDQTIVLAVVSGAYDLQVQRIFEMFEPYQARTLGVITAPDMVERGTARATTFQQLVANASFKAGHEWYVLRNLSHREVQDGEDRDEVEMRFFAHRAVTPNDVWRSVTDSRLGVENLKLKLGTLLQQKIVNGLPQIQRQLRSALHDCTQNLNLLGVERITSEQQRNYLADRSDKIRAETTKELTGGGSKKSLRSRIRNANDEFADSMVERGATWSFPVDKTATSHHVSLDDANVEDLPMLILDDTWLNGWVDEASNSRGLELDGMVDPVWIGRMFLRQSQKWRALAESHADETFGIVMQHFDYMIKHIVGAENAPRFLEHVIYPELQRRNVALREEIEELLSPYTTENIRTLNQRFRKRRTRETGSPLPGGIDNQGRTRNTLALYTFEMIDYYNLALDVFVDNVESLAIENVLLGGLEDIMTATKAHKMKEEQVAALAAESEDTTFKRHNLQDRVREYQEGIHLISVFMARSPKGVSNINNGTPRVLATSQRSTPKVVIVPTTTISIEDPDATGGRLPDPTETARGDSSLVLRDRTRSTSGSSRSSSTSRIFSEDGNDDDDGGCSSDTSSAEPSPLKKVYRNAQGVSPSPPRAKVVRNRSSRGELSF